MRNDRFIVPIPVSPEKRSRGRGNTEKGKRAPGEFSHPDRLGELHLAGGARGLGLRDDHKYAEGYAGKRYYNGCAFVDEVEVVAIERIKKLFGAEVANVQPHSGSQANMAVLMSVLSPGDTFMGMNLSHGGHLSHGSPVNFSGLYYRVVSYGVKQDTGRIDYDAAAQTAK